MGRKHNDVFVIGPERLDFADFGSGDEKDSGSAARAWPPPGAPASSDDAEVSTEPAASMAPQGRGLGHRPLSRPPSATRPNLAEGLIGRPRSRRVPLRAAAALGVGACIAIAAIRSLSAVGGDSRGRTSTSPAAQIAQAAPALPPAPPAPIAASRHRGAGSRERIERAGVQAAQRPPGQSEAPPPAVGPSRPTLSPPLYASADSFGFER